MPNCFRLMRKDDPMGRSVSFKVIDDEMRTRFGEGPHVLNFYYDWYSIIGWMIAVDGLDFPAIHRRLATFTNMPVVNQRLVDICDWMAGNFVAEHWVQIGLRKD